MSRFKSYTFIEKPPVLFGISLIDLLLVLVLFIGLMLVGGIFFVVGMNWSGFYILSFFLCLALIVFLKKTNTNRQPGFLISFYSFHVLQRRTFHVGNGKFHFQFLKSEADEKIKVP